MNKTFRKTPVVFCTNVYIVLIIYLLIAMVFYSVCRIFFYLFNTSYFPNMTAVNFLNIMYGGFQFDLSAVLYSNILFILLLIIPHPWRYRPAYKNVLKWIFISINSVAIATNVIDFIYYRFTLRRTTMLVFSQFKHEQNLPGLFAHFLITYWYAALLFILLTIILKNLYERIDYKRYQINSWRHYITSVLFVPIIVMLFIAGVRGGFAHSTRPITLSNAAQFGNEPRDESIVLNTPFALIRTARTQVIKKVNYFSSEAALNRVFTPLHIPDDTSKFRYDNVVIIIIESFSKEFVGAYNKSGSGNYQSYTPFMDSLISKSRAYQYSLANGRRSIEAMPSVLCSIPSVEVPFFLSHYSGDTVNSLASLLKEKGYYSAFFHGAANGSMGFLAFSKAAGFNDYYGKTEYNNDKDYDGIWGIWDEPFLQFFANKLNTFKQPFLASVFTVSSHDPFKTPSEFKNVFKGGPLTIDKCVQYTDYSLKRFFETAEKMPWFKNTLFVLTADHAAAQTYYPQYSSIPGYFSIPVFFYKTGEDWSEVKQEAIDQIDIMPTVLGYLHYNKPYIAFGRDVFKEDTTPYAFNYLNDTYNYFSGNYLLLFQNSKPIALYNYKKDFTQKNNLLTQMPDTVQALSDKVKALIQQYNNRIVDNALTVEGSQLQLHAQH